MLVAMVIERWSDSRRESEVDAMLVARAVMLVARVVMVMVALLLLGYSGWLLGCHYGSGC